MRPNEQHYQIIAVRDLPTDQLDRLARLAVEWMADELVVEEEPSACLPEGRRGHRPAEAWQSAIVEIDEYFLQLEINGVEVSTGRQIFDAGEYESTPYCPKCHEALEAGDSRRAAWRSALQAWESGDDEAALECPACRADSPIVEWRHDAPIGFGNLGLIFWNWPSLNREFISRLERLLERPVVLVEGRYCAGTAKTNS